MDYKKIIPDEYLPTGLRFTSEKYKPEIIGIVVGMIIPALLGIIFAVIGVRNIRRKKKLGYLETIFAVMMIAFCIMNIRA